MLAHARAAPANRPTQLGRRSAQSDSQRPRRRAAEFAQKQPPAGVWSTRLLRQGLGARSSPVSALSRWTTSTTDRGLRPPAAAEREILRGERFSVGAGRRPNRNTIKAGAWCSRVNDVRGAAGSRGAQGDRQFTRRLLLLRTGVVGEDVLEIVEARNAPAAHGRVVLRQQRTILLVLAEIADHVRNPVISDRPHAASRGAGRREERVERRRRA